MTPGSRIRRAAAGLAMSGLVTALAGCGSDGRQVGSTSLSQAAYPVVAVQQAHRILGAVNSSLATGSRSGSVAGFGPRITGPYRELTVAQTKVARIRKTSLPTEPAMEQLALIVPATSSWPRFFVAAGRPAGGTTPRLRVLVSPSAREPYALWGELTVLPGITLPAVAAAGTGAPALEEDTAGLACTPRRAVELFAQYLTRGPRSPGAEQIRGSAFSNGALRRIIDDRDRLKGAATITSTHVADPNRIFALRTSDGGALVIGVLVQRYVITVNKGRTVELKSDADLAALAGTQKFSSSFTRTSLEVAAFAVPPAGKGRVTVIAAEKGDVGAVAK